MKAILSRRHWMTTSLACALCANQSLADEPVSDATPVAANALPIRSQTLRLTPVVADLNQTLITAIAADPQGKVIAAAGDDHAIRIISTKSLRVVRTLQGHRDLIRTLAFDRAGERLASAGIDGQVIVWDRLQRFSIAQRMRGAPAISCVRFSPDGQELAAVGFDSRVYLMTRGKRETSRLNCGCNDLKAVAYRDDNQLLAVAGRSGALHLFDVNRGVLVGEHTIHQGRVHAIEFLRDSNLVVSVSEDGTVSVFDTQQRKLLSQTKITTGKLFALAVLDSQHVAVAGSDNRVGIVNTTTGKVVTRLGGHHGSVSTLCCAGDDLFSGGYDATLQRWGTSALTNKARIAEGTEPIDR